MRTVNRIFIFLLVAASMASCNGFGLQKDYKYKSEPLDPHVNMNAWEFMQSREDLSEMVRAVEYAGLQELYTQEDDCYTYLFINNDGMSNFVIAKGHVDICNVPVEYVTRMLQYHVVVGEYHAYDKKLPVEPIYVKNNLEGEWGLMTIKVNKSSQNSIGHPISNGNIVVNETGSNFKSKRISSVTSNIMPTNGVIHIFNDYSTFRKDANYTTAY